jgi:hypothetical protein
VLARPRSLWSDAGVTTRTAQCACGRVEITVDGEPLRVLVCHCDFCQKRTGSVFQVSAQFSPDHVVAISGATKGYNGLEVDGVGPVVGAEAIDYRFCETCGSTVYWNITLDGQAITGIAVGNFVDPDFPVPTIEAFTRLRHRWVPPVPDAVQFDPGA